MVMVSKPHAGGNWFTLATKHHPPVVANQTGETDSSSSFRDSSRPPLKGGSIHFHHQKTGMAMFIIGVSATLHFFLGRSSNLLLAGLQIFSSADSDVPHSLLQRNVSSDVCLLHSDLVSGDCDCSYDSIEDSTLQIEARVLSVCKEYQW